MKAATLAGKRKSVRQVALEVLYKIEQEGWFAEEAVAKSGLENRLSSADQRLLAELVLGTTKMKKRLDHILGQLVKKDSQRLTFWIRNILRLGIYQLEFTSRIPDYATVNESVNLASRYGHPGVAGLVNAVLRNYPKQQGKLVYPNDKSEYISAFYSFPEWLVEKWLALFGQEGTVRLCQYFNQKPRMGFRVNELRSSEKEIQKYSQDKSVPLQKGRYAEKYFYFDSPIELDRFDLLQTGKIYIQDQASLLAAELLDPQPGETVLDLCAAPGGKTCYLAQKMQNQGELLAVDKTESKLQLLRENIDRLGIEIVQTVRADATDFKRQKVDRILVDAPCSGTGVLNHNADARWQKMPQDLERLSELQLKILENAIILLKSEGILVYSTCSIVPEENQSVVERLLKRHLELKLETAAQLVPLELVTPEGYLQTLPFEHNLDGVFAARFAKR
jgi:16S rRNA (cytosine967-C5)-methyltransferase